MNKPLFNTFDSMPFIPYNIVAHLANDPVADDLFKLLKYNTYDAISQPSLSLKEKMSMIYKNQPQQNDYNIFLNRLVEDEETAERTILKVYKNNSDRLSRLSLSPHRRYGNYFNAVIKRRRCKWCGLASIQR